MYLVLGNVFEYIFSLGTDKKTSKDIRRTLMAETAPGDYIYSWDFFGIYIYIYSVLGFFFGIYI